MRCGDATTKIMIVDDVPMNLKVLDTILRSLGYSVFAFPRGDMFLRAARNSPPDLVLLDINLPDMDGYRICTLLKEDAALRDIPVIFVSALAEPLDKVKAFGAGGVDYITKPFDLAEVQARVTTHLEIHRLRRELERTNRALEERVRDQVREIADSQLATILALAKLAESRDDETGCHLERVRGYCRILAERVHDVVRDMDLHAHELFVQCISDACVLHDIGKVGIEDAILRKPGRLVPEEFEIMKRHTVIGADTLESVRVRYPGNPFLSMGIDIALSHHERWDGSGYPDRLGGTGIPLAARIMAIADVYDALRSERCYKPPMAHRESVRIISDASGSQFDPDLVRIFLSVQAAFEAAYRADSVA